MCYCMVLPFIKSLMVSGRDTVDSRVVGYCDTIKTDLCRSSMATPSSPNGEKIIQIEQSLSSY